jgi:thioesterase domain-containing protein
VWAAVTAIIEALEIQASDVCLSFTPMFHILGIYSGLLVPLAAGGRSVVLPGLEVRRFFDHLAEYGPTWFPAVPPLLKSIVEYASEHPEAIQGAPLRFIRSGGSPLSPNLAEQIEKTLGAPVLQVYGSSEAPTIALQTLDGRARKRGSIGRIICNELAIFDENDYLLPPGASGEIAVRGPAVIQEYFRNDAITRRAIRNGWFRTGDIGYVDAGGYLFLTGRQSEFINRGGEKISPAEVDGILLSHPGVFDAVTFPVPDEELGQEIGAAIVLRPGAQVSTRDLQAFAALTLSVHKIPRRIFFVDAIPKGPTGKVKRTELSAWLAVPEIVRSPGAIDDVVDDREEILAGLFSKALGISDVGRRENFFDLGGGSLAATQCAAEIRLRFSLSEFSPAAFLWAPTVAEMAKVLAGDHNPDSAFTFPIDLSADGVPLLLVDANLELQPLARAVGRKWPVLGIRMPNLLRPDAPRTLEGIAQECVSALRRRRPDGPYAPAGFCGFGLLALEMARQLERQGAAVTFVAILDAREIFLPPMSWLRKTLVRATYQAQRIGAFLARVRSQGLLRAVAIRWNTPNSPPSFERLFAAIRRYRPQPWNGRLIHIWASDGRHGRYRGVNFAWDHLFPHGFEYHEVPGEHEAMLKHPRLAEILSAELRKANSRETSAARSSQS